MACEGGISFPDNLCQVVIDDFAFDAGDRLPIKYNFFENWLHDVCIEAIHEKSNSTSPFCLRGHGMLGVTLSDEIDKTT
ncbi:IS1096 element passenger TnpR family protein [Photorhabdus sp. SF281]|uniref:IS1096 element passenger TnpR family protein n=1 Tax=Photorhabdus sp. SF281 TaxID=3459527 RepID=UPI0040441CA9